MTVRWVFSRDDQQTSIEVLSLPDGCALSIRHPHGDPEHTTVPTVMEAVLLEAILERGLTTTGWQLRAFQRLQT